MKPLQKDQEYRQTMARLDQIHGSAKPGTPEGDEYEKDGTVKWSEPPWISDLKSRFPRLFKGIDEFNFAVGEGWKGIINGLCERLDAQISHRVVITQIKEKFGGLRVYTTHSSEGVTSLIMVADEAAMHLRGLRCHRKKHQICNPL
jgi:hypothetical protein